jgi:GNAT superfamily N-acetyltransferase
MAKVELTFYIDPAVGDALDYRLSAPQSDFSSIPLDLIRDETLRQDPRRSLVAMRWGGLAVGLFQLNTGLEKMDYGSNPQSILLRSFSINPAFQGKGMAKEILRQLPDFIRRNFPEVNEVLLSVNKRNPHAHRLYSDAGFTDTGRLMNGPFGEQYILSFKLKVVRFCLFV